MHHDWEHLLGTLERRSDITIAAIRDDVSAPGIEAWARLGDTVLVPMDSFDEYQLGSQLRLIVPSLDHIPLPLAEPAHVGLNAHPLRVPRRSPSRSGN
jgi:hypothetical protein